MRRTLHLTVLLGLSLALAGCASRRSDPTNTTAQEETLLVVKNDSYLDHNIYLLQGLQRIRMGTARGLATTRLTIPRQYVFGVSALQFLADPIGGNVTPVSERINVSPGDEVQLVIRGDESKGPRVLAALIPSTAAGCGLGSESAVGDASGSGPGLLARHAGPPQSRFPYRGPDPCPSNHHRHCLLLQRLVREPPAE